MQNFNFKLKPKTEKKLLSILKRYSNKEKFFDDVIKYEISELKKGIMNIEIEIKKYEKKYALSSNDFYQKFEKGKLGDKNDFMIWSGIYEMQLRNKSKLEELTW